MKQKREERLLRQWKIRQEAEGYDVSGVTTLEEAEKFFEKKATEETAVTEPAEPNTVPEDDEPQAPEAKPKSKKKAKVEENADNPVD